MWVLFAGLGLGVGESPFAAIAVGRGGLQVARPAGRRVESPAAAAGHSPCIFSDTCGCGEDEPGVA